MTKFLDITGERYGLLTAIRRMPGSATPWLVRCDCGAEKVVRLCNLRTGNVKSCGCLRHRTKHGQSGTPEWRTWVSIRDRCRPDHRQHTAYYDRGIRVCDRWLDFDAFLTDMGTRPSAAHSIDRRDNAGSYTCGRCADCIERGASSNCRWATSTEQNRNTRHNRYLAFAGRTQLVVDWAADLGISPRLLSARLNTLGWSVDRALSTPAPRKPRATETTGHRSDSHE